MGVGQSLGLGDELSPPFSEWFEDSFTVICFVANLLVHVPFVPSSMSSVLDGPHLGHGLAQRFHMSAAVVDTLRFGLANST